jgi:hypothetical protein
MAKNANKKSLKETNITILTLKKKKKKLMDSVNVQIYKIDIGLQKRKKKLMDSVNVQIYKIDIGKLIFVKKIY